MELRDWALHYHRCGRCGGFVPCQYSNPLYCAESQKDISRSCGHAAVEPEERHYRQGEFDRKQRYILHFHVPGLTGVNKGQNRNLTSLFGSALKRYAESIANKPQPAPAAVSTKRIKPKPVAHPGVALGLSGTVYEMGLGTIHSRWVKHQPSAHADWEAENVSQWLGF